jgi:hypothetical protein
MSYIDYYQRTMERIADLKRYKKNPIYSDRIWWLDRLIEDNENLLKTLLEVTRKH